jgi:hypothetical protein
MALLETSAEVRKSGIDGRGLFATKGIEAGQLIFKKSRPLVAALDVQRLEDTCANCFQSQLGGAIYDPTVAEHIADVKKCTGCRMVAYCGKVGCWMERQNRATADLNYQTCQSQHWKRCHNRVCKILQRALVNVPYLKENPHTISNVTFALVEMIEMRNKLAMSEQEWISVLQLKAHAKEMKAKDSQRYQEAELIAERVLIHLGYPADYSKDFVTQLTCALLTNSLTLVAPTCDPLGLVFDPFACLANHSCEPNAYVIMNGPELSFRTLKDIRKDDEILVSYIDSSEAFNIRQAQLAKRFYFVCRCLKCIHGPNLPQDVFLTPSPEIQRKFKQSVDGMRKEIPTTISMMKQRVGLEDAKLTYSDIIDCYARNDLLLANELDMPGLDDNLVQDSITPTEMLRRVLAQCRMSGQYEVTRQPYAAARDQYILKNIDQGEFGLAWVHAVKSYVEIDPSLYPEPHNPLRVVHAFRLAKLSTYLASGPSEKNQGIIDQCIEAGLDMPILSWRCMKEAAQHADASHGEDSPFTHTVKATFKAALEEMQAMSPTAIARIESQMDALEPALQRIAASLPY